MIARRHEKGDSQTGELAIDEAPLFLDDRQIIRITVDQIPEMNYQSGTYPVE
jgi:hypothetical protein